MLTNKNFEAYRFVIIRLKALICDEYGNPEFMEPMDDILFDLFGVKQFTRKIARRYENREIARVIDTIGLKYLMELLNNAKYYAMLNDMIQMLYHLDDLKRVIRKQRRKGKRDRSLIKEYTYLNDLYKRALKFFRKKLNIKNPKTAYKRRYQALDGMLKKSSFYGGDYSSIGLGGFDMDDPYDDDYGKRSYYEDDPYDDYEDDYEFETSSPYDDFVKDLHEREYRSPRRPVGNTKRYNRAQQASEFDDYDPYDDASYETPGESKIEDRIDKLADVVLELSSGLNNFMVKQSYDQTHPRRPINVDDDPYDAVDSEISVEDEISEKLEEMEDTQKLLAGALGEILEWRKELEEILFEDEEETQSEEDETSKTAFVPKDFHPTQDEIVVTNEVKNEQSEEEKLSRTDLIGKVNHDNPKVHEQKRTN